MKEVSMKINTKGFINFFKNNYKYFYPMAQCVNFSGPMFQWQKPCLRRIQKQLHTGVCFDRTNYERKDIFISADNA